MADESSGLWNNVPSIIIVEIFSYLSLKDRLRASSVCKTWRNNLFHPRLWHKVVFQLNSCDKTIVNNHINDGARFLAKHCGHFVREVVIEVNSSKFSDFKIFKDILRILSFNNNLRALSIKPRSSRLEWADYQIKQLFLKQYLDFLIKIIKRAHCLEHLSLGNIEELSDLAEYIMEPLAKHQALCLRSLHISSIKEVPGIYSTFDMNCSLFQTFIYLESLSIDFHYMSDQLLEILSHPHRKSLQRLNVHVHSSDYKIPEIQSSAWKQIKAHSPNLEVAISLLHFQHHPENVYDILNDEMPLTHLRIYFSPSFDLEILAHIALVNGSSLQSLTLINDLNEDLTTSSFLIYGVDPLIMLAWRCKRLSKIKIIGYEVAADSLIAISRLRGEQLKELKIPECCISTLQVEEMLNISQSDAMSHLQIQVELALKDYWRPMNLLELPRSVHNANYDEAYLVDLLMDQVW